MTRVFVVFSIHQQQIPSWFRKWQFFEIKIKEVDDNAYGTKSNKASI